MKNAPAMQFPYSSQRLRQPKCLQFGIISPDEMREMSVTNRRLTLVGKTDHRARHHGTSLTSMALPSMEA